MDDKINDKKAVKTIEKAEKTAINKAKKRDQDIEREFYKKFADLKKWQRQVFHELVSIPLTGQKVVDIAREHNLRRETVSRFFHSKTFEDLAVLYAKEEIVTDLLPLAQEAIKEILLNGKDNIRGKIALEVYKMAKLSQVQETSKQTADKIYNINVSNETINQLNISELENLASEKILEIKKLMGVKKND